MVRLNEANLLKISERVPVFKYSRSSVSPTVVHFGVGRFHRAHQALVLDRLLETGENCGILGINIVPDSEFERQFRAQDFLYSVTEIDSETHATRIVGSILNFKTLHGDDWSCPVENVKLVTCTLTQAGYYYDPSSGAIDLTSLPKENIYLALSKLAERISEVCFVISCDNIPSNSHLLEAGFKRYLECFEPQNVERKLGKFKFLTSVVDRVTPVANQELVNRYLTPINLLDLCPVFCETHFDWVIQKDDQFPFPQLARFGVQFVDDVSFYEWLKLRILNLSHFIIGLIGTCENIQFVHEVISTDEYRVFLERIIFYEVIPSGNLLNNREAYEYACRTLQRFSNHALPDQCSRLTRNTPVKIKNLILATINNCLQRELRCDGLQAVVALWQHLVENNKIKIDQQDMISLNSDPDYEKISQKVGIIKASLGQQPLKKVLLSYC